MIILGMLLWSFWRAMLRLRSRYAAFVPILGWLVGLGFFILAPLTVMVLNGGYEMPSFYDVSDSYARVDLSNLKYFTPFLVISLSLLLAFGTIILFAPEPGNDKRRAEVVFDQSKLKRVVLVTAGLALLDYLAKIWMQGGFAAFFLSHWYNRQGDLVARLGDSYVFYSWLSQANQIVFTAGAVLYTHCELKRRRIDWRFSMLILLLFLLQTVMTGNRIFFALYLLSFGISCWLLRRKKLIALLLTIAPALVLVFSAWAYFRANLADIGENIPGYFDNDLGNPTVTSLMNALEGGDTMLLFHVINDYGSKYEFMYGASYARVLVFWIPRRFYQDKAAGFSSQLAAIYEPGTSLAATQLGELYANFGLFSVLLLPVITMLILSLSEKLTSEPNNHALLPAVTFLLSIWFARSSFDDNFITFVFVMLLLWVLRLEQGLCSRIPTTLAPHFESA